MRSWFEVTVQFAGVGVAGGAPWSQCFVRGKLGGGRGQRQTCVLALDWDFEVGAVRALLQSNPRQGFPVCPSLRLFCIVLLRLSRRVLSLLHNRQ